MSRKGCDFPLRVEWHSACNFPVQLSFAAEIFRALVCGRERDIEAYEKLYSRGLLTEHYANIIVLELWLLNRGLKLAGLTKQNPFAASS